MRAMLHECLLRQPTCCSLGRSGSSGIGRTPCHSSLIFQKCCHHTKQKSAPRVDRAGAWAVTRLWAYPVSLAVCSTNGNGLHRDLCRARTENALQEVCVSCSQCTKYIYAPLELHDQLHSWQLHHCRLRIRLVAALVTPVKRHTHLNLAV